MNSAKIAAHVRIRLTAKSNQLITSAIFWTLTWLFVLMHLL